MTTYTLTSPDGKTTQVMLTLEQMTALGLNTSKVWKPEKDEKYYTVDDFDTWTSHQCEEILYSCGLVFKTLEERDQKVKQLQAEKRIKDYILENFGEWIPDWNGRGLKKYYVYYYHGMEKFDWSTDISCQTQCKFYLKSSDNAEQLIRDCEEDLKILFNIS